MGLRILDEVGDLWKNALELHDDLAELKRTYKASGKPFLMDKELKEIDGMEYCLFVFLQFQFPLGGFNSLVHAQKLYLDAKSECERLRNGIRKKSEESTPNQGLETFIQ